MKIVVGSYGRLRTCKALARVMIVEGHKELKVRIIESVDHVGHSHAKGELLRIWVDEFMPISALELLALAGD